jgi:L-malate glycosyltransferase
LLVTICRLTKHKRPDVSVRVAETLRSLGIKAHLLLLGDGPMRSELEAMVAKLGLSNEVSIAGHVGNPLDYLAAADVVLHPSLLESSCVVIKEAGLLKKPVVVCQGIGDFDEYMKDGYNGFVAAGDVFHDNAVKLLVEGRWTDQRLCENLRVEILSRFAIGQVITQYEALVSNYPKL